MAMLGVLFIIHCGLWIVAIIPCEFGLLMHPGLGCFLVAEATAIFWVLLCVVAELFWPC